VHPPAPGKKFTTKAVRRHRQGLSTESVDLDDQVLLVGHDDLSPYELCQRQDVAVLWTPFERHHRFKMLPSRNHAILEERLRGVETTRVFRGKVAPRLVEDPIRESGWSFRTAGRFTGVDAG
jgi:hypothetical protein